MAYLFFAGCSSHEASEDDPQAILKQAEVDIKAGRYLVAMEKLQDVKNRFPYAKASTDAHIRIADVYFMQDSFIEAAATYEAFADLHPKYERIDYARFRAALSYYKDIPELVARDLNSAVHAENSFKDFIIDFPHSTYLSEANGFLVKTREKLAAKEMYIAEFYYKRKAFEAAKARFQKVIDHFSDTSFYERARKRVQECEQHEVKS